jgi:hypothetical protein
MRKAYPAAAITASLLQRFTAPMAFGDGNTEEDLDLDLEEEENSDDDSAVAAAEAQSAEAKAIEAQARAQGWRPEAEFKGEGKWVDAATFVDRGNRFKKNLEKEVATLKEQVAAQKKTNEQFAAFHKQAMERKDSELSEAIRKARLDHKEAIRNGEDEDALVLEDRIESLREEKAKLKEEPAKKEEPVDEAAAKQSSDDAALLEWVEDGNQWFRDDHKLRAYALAIGQEMRAAGDLSRDRTFLDKIRAQMEDEMPDRFAKGNPLRRKAGAVETGSSGAQQQQQGKTERDLPKQDRELMNKFVKDGLLTKEQFLKDYNWS